MRAWWRLARKYISSPVVPTIATAFGTFVAFALQGFVLARMLGPQSRGEYGTVVLYTQALMFIALLGPSYAITRRAASAPERTAALSRSAARLGVVKGMCTLLVVILLSIFTLPNDKAFLWPLCILSALVLPLEHTRLYLLAVDRGAGRFRRYNTNQLLSTAIFPVVLAVAWFMGIKNVWPVVCLSFIGPVLGLLSRVSVERPSELFLGDCNPRPTALLREGTPYFATVAISDVFGRLDALLFLWLGSFIAQGYYAAAAASATLLLVVPNALALFTFNMGASGKPNLTAKQLVLATIALFGVQIATAGVFALLLGPLIRLVYGAAFAGAVPLALALLPAQALNGFGQVIDGYLRGRGKVAPGIQARCVGAVVMLAVTMGLHQRLQEMAIPLAASIAQLCVAGMLGATLMFEAKEIVRQ